INDLTASQKVVERTACLLASVIALYVAHKYRETSSSSSGFSEGRSSLSASTSSSVRHCMRDSLAASGEAAQTITMSLDSCEAIVTPGHLLSSSRTASLAACKLSETTTS